MGLVPEIKLMMMMMNAVGNHCPRCSCSSPSTDQWLIALCQ